MSQRYDSQADFNDYVDGGAKVKKGKLVVGELEFLVSKLLFDGDSDGYSEALRRWQSDRETKLIRKCRSLLRSSQQEKRFQRLVQQGKTGRLVPFIGAGLSVPCGYPAWRELLLTQAEGADLDKEKVTVLIEEGRFEKVIGLLLGKMKEHWVDQSIIENYSVSLRLKGPVKLIPQLFTGCVVTTNFDDVLERVYVEQGVALHPVHGRDLEAFTAKFDDGDGFLYKLHGAAEEPANRVLTPEEYQAAYGEGTPDRNRPLVKALAYVFSRSRLLFMGCSLLSDRNMDVFLMLKEKKENRRIFHFAFLERPPGKAAKAEREKFLSERGITPIWYPVGEHDYVEAFLLALRIDLNAR